MLYLTGLMHWVFEVSGENRQFGIKLVHGLETDKHGVSAKEYEYREA